MSIKADGTLRRCVSLAGALFILAGLAFLASDLSNLVARSFYRVFYPTEQRALQLQADLAQCGLHRMPPVDLLIAAAAERHGLTVLHCDRDFDVIRERTSVALSAEWLAPPATFS